MSSTIPKPTAPLSLAGKPPYATDEPDSFYETPHISPSQRIRAQLILPAATANSEMQNKRTSAYDVYDNYLPTATSTSASANPNASLNPFAAPEDAAANRNSGLGALLLNLDDSDDDSDDDDDARRTKTAMPTTSSAVGNGNGNKHAALAAAVSTSASERAGQISPSKAAVQQKHVPPPQQQQRQQQQVQFQQQHRGPQPIAAPQPGYPAPIAALNLAHPFPQAQGPPQMRQIPMPAPLRINPNVQNPFEPQMHSAQSSSSPFAPAMASPYPRPDSTSPHPLLPPVTPITPAFIRPSKSTSSGVPPPAAIKFDEGSLHDPAGVRGMPRPNKAIIRGDTEETLLPSRGEKGDDFWRRFSMVAKLEDKGGKGANKSKGGRESSWLARTQNGKDSYSRWVWLVGVVLLLIIVGAVGCGVYFTRGDPEHQQPKVFGGSADQAATYTTSATGKVVTGPGGTSTVLHVTPTNTVARREVEGPEPTMPPVVAIVGKRMHIGANAKRRLQNGVW